jgi:hypothetical protein
VKVNRRYRGYVIFRVSKPNKKPARMRALFTAHFMLVSYLAYSSTMKMDLIRREKSS